MTDWLRGVEELGGLPQGGLQISGEDFGEEPRPLQHEGRGDPGGEETVCGVQSVSGRV